MEHWSLVCMDRFVEGRGAPPFITYVLGTTSNVAEGETHLVYSMTTINVRTKANHAHDRLP